MSVRNVKDYLDPKDQPRNAKCDCGSGLKYKKCHGRPQKMDLTTYYKGRILDFQFNETTDKKEHDSLLKFVTELKENGLPLCLPNVKFDIKLLEIHQEALGEDTEFPSYTILIKGEII